MPHVRVLALNLHNPVSPGNLERAARFLDDSGAEVFALSECATAAWRSLSRLLDCAGAAHAPAPYWGNAILTRTLPLVTVAAVTLGERHSRELRSAAVADIDAGGTRLRVVATHLDHLDEDTRIEQYRQLAADSRAQLSSSLLMGDLNALCRSDQDEAGWGRIAAERRAARLQPSDHRLLDQILARDGFRDSATPADASEPTSRFGTRVDYVLLGPDCPAAIVPGSYAVLPAIAEGVTDHNAVSVELRVDSD